MRYRIDLFFTHTVKTVKKQHLRLRVEKNITEVTSIIMIQQSFQRQPCAGANGKRLGKTTVVPERKQFFAQRFVIHPGFNKLLQQGGRKNKINKIYAFHFFLAMKRSIGPALAAFGLVPAAVHIADSAE